MKSKIIPMLALFFALLQFNCNAQNTVDVAEKGDQAITIGKILDNKSASITFDRAKLSKAIRLDFDATAINDLTIENLSGYWLLYGNCRESSNEEYGFWISLFAGPNGGLQLKPEGGVHTCKGTKCSSCKLMLFEAGVGACDCKAHSTATDDGYCEHSVSSGSAVSAGIIKNLGDDGNTK